MNISSKAEYGIRAIVAIAGADRPVKRADIAARQSIPVPFLTQVLRALVNGGLVKSSRGPEGGYALGRPAEAITLLDIVTELQGQIMPKGCLDATRPEICLVGGSDCLLRDVWAALKSANERVLASVSVGDLVSAQSGWSK